MMQTYDPEYLDAFARLLARPDPADLPRRAHLWRYEGDPNRRATCLPRILMAWMQRRHLEVDVQESYVSAARTWKRRERRATRAAH